MIQFHVGLITIKYFQSTHNSTDKYKYEYEMTDLFHNFLKTFRPFLLLSQLKKLRHHLVHAQIKFCLFEIVLHSSLLIFYCRFRFYYTDLLKNDPRELQLLTKDKQRYFK